MRSKQIDLPFWPDYCKRIFGDGLPDNHTEITNSHYGGLDIKGENIFFANASEDPWQWAGMRQLHKEQSKMQVGYIDCTDCGHCIDFHTPTPDQPAELTKV